MVKGFTVALESNLKQEEADQLRKTLLNIRGVQAVEPLHTTLDDFVVDSRIRSELFGKIYEVFFPKKAK